MIDKIQARLNEINAPADVKALVAQLAAQAVRDPLTGLYNRRFFDESLSRNVEAARRYGRDLSLVLFDLDRLKALNDRAGHAAGDAALRRFAAVLSQTVRAADVVCRIGGDEFAVILPETARDPASHFIKRFFQNLTAAARSFPGDWTLSASVGAAALPIEPLFAAADAALLRAKAQTPRLRE